MKSSSPHSLLTLQLLALKAPTPEHELKFHPRRKWRWDLCWPDQMLAIEVHGAVWTRGRHLRPKGFTDDRTKVNAGVERGWRVLEFTTDQIESGEAVRQIMRLLKATEAAKVA
jgi:very-short-patch-repair endonuclease